MIVTREHDVAGVEIGDVHRDLGAGLRQLFESPQARTERSATDGGTPGRASAAVLRSAHRRTSAFDRIGQ